MFEPDDLGGKPGFHLTYTVHDPDDREPYIRVTLELVIAKRIIFSIPLWKYRH